MNKIVEAPAVRFKDNHIIFWYDEKSFGIDLKQECIKKCGAGNFLNI